MTTIKTTRFRLPDPPEREPDEMTSTKHLTMTGSAHYLAEHLGNPETTLVTAELYVTEVPHPGRGGRRRRPDLLVAYGVDPELYYQSNGYVISEQGKPPDFVLEVASESTAEIDLGAKRDDYAAFGQSRDRRRADGWGASSGYDAPCPSSWRRNVSSMVSSSSSQ